MKKNLLIAIYKKIIVGDKKSWVLFKNGTCVIFTHPEGDIEKQAVKILRENGTVIVGTPFADFSVVTLAHDPGWVVTGKHPDVLAYVSPDEVGEDQAHIYVGLVGRAKFDDDAKKLMVVHVEDTRTQTAHE